MVSLGKLGTPKQAEVIAETTFDYFGTEIHLIPKRFSELEFIDFMEEASNVDERDPQAAVQVKRMLRLVLPTERSQAAEAELRVEIADLQHRLVGAEDDEDRLRLINQIAKLQVQVDNGDPFKGHGFETFWRVAIANDQQVEDLMAVFIVLMEAMTNRPTQRPADSSAGPPRTPPNSPADSSSPPASPGRPDIQAIHDEGAARMERLRAV